MNITTIHLNDLKWQRKYRRKYYMILYTFTLWPYWPTLKQLNPLPRGHGFHNSGRSLHGNHIHVISFMPPPPFIRIKALVRNEVGWGSGGCPFTIFRQHTEFNMPAMLWFWLYIMKKHGKWFFVYFDDLAVLKDLLSQNHLIKGHIWEWEFRNTRVGMG